MKLQLTTTQRVLGKAQHHRELPREFLKRSGVISPETTQRVPGSPHLDHTKGPVDKYRNEQITE